MSKRNLLIGAAALLVLAVTHWFAYNRGVQEALEEDAPRLEFAEAMDPSGDLYFQIDVLRIAVKFPDDFSKKDLQRWRDETEATLSAVETETLNFLKKKGDEGEEKRVRAMILETHNLLSKLPK